MRTVVVLLVGRQGIHIFVDRLAKTTCFHSREECRQDLSVCLVIQVFDRIPNS